ncbi:hypothetical protein FRZ67_06525 [Panacibacter ginsenosidivorans]|uniref:DUF4468 domain-containing protein n=1 Tax=Panacibacter ginsenosidivorans TaxID=1813871 RepID=A0A5B8V9D8_9BACT|nr:hypothetical protein [Panacibacter ginsenosidivorans]QEC66968.1 hypothetical protein FRZ67_06525 [Panacibacter ginsenosidivorans]
MRKIIFVFFFLFAAKLSFAQHLTYTMYEILHKEDMKSSPVAFDNQYDGIIGNGFLTEAWVMGRVFTSTRMYTDLKLKFDVHTNKIYVNLNDTIFDISTSGIIQFDIFPNSPDTTKIISFSNGINLEEITPDKFVSFLADGKITFIKYYVKDIEEVYESSPTYKEKKFIDKNKYYVIEDGQPGKEISLGKKNLEKLLAAKWDAVNSYAKTNGISAGSEDGWAKLINYYNTLP